MTIWQQTTAIHQIEVGKEQLRTKCLTLLFTWWIILTCYSFVFSLLPFRLVPHLPVHTLSISLHLFNCSSPPPSLLDCYSFPHYPSQSSASVEGPGWSRGPSASSVPSPAAWRGRVPDGAQIQERPGAEAEDPAAGTFSATTPGGPLPHRGVPWGDIWGKKTNYTNTHKKKKHTWNAPKTSLDSCKHDTLT